MRLDHEKKHSKHFQNIYAYNINYRFFVKILQDLVQDDGMYVVGMEGVLTEDEMYNTLKVNFKPDLIFVCMISFE